MHGGHDLLDSERGTWCVCLAFVALVLVLLRFLSGAEWVSFMQWVTITLVVAKTATGIAESKIAHSTPGAT